MAAVDAILDIVPVAVAAGVATKVLGSVKPKKKSKGKDSFGGFFG